MMPIGAYMGSQKRLVCTLIEKSQMNTDVDATILRRNSRNHKNNCGNTNHQDKARREMKKIQQRPKPKVVINRRTEKEVCEEG
jgi:hypothetical protein